VTAGACGGGGGGGLSSYDAPLIIAHHVTPEAGPAAPPPLGTSNSVAPATSATSAINRSPMVRPMGCERDQWRRMTTQAASRKPASRTHGEQGREAKQNTPD